MRNDTGLGVNVAGSQYADCMGEQLDEFLNLDIPEELYLSRNIQTMLARVQVTGASNEEAVGAVLSVVAANVMDLEQRLVALEDRVEQLEP